MSMTGAVPREAGLLRVVVTGLLAMMPGIAFAQTNGAWSATTGGSWPTASNWTSSQIANGASGTAQFTSAIAGTQVVTLDGDRTIGAIRLGSGGAANIFSLQMGTSGTLTLQTSSGSPSIDVASSRSGIIGLTLAGNQGFTKTGAGTLYVGGVNTYSGTTTVSAGTLEVRTADALGATGAGNETVVTTNSRVRIGADITTNESFTINGAGTTGALNFGSSATGVNVSTATVGGLVTLGSDATVGVSSSSFGFLDRNGAGDSINTNGFALTIQNSGVLTVKNPISGAGSLTVNGNGQLYLTAANTYTGTTGWTGATGNLWLGDGGTGGSLSTSSVITLSNPNAKFGVNQSDTVTQGVDFSGSAITGNGIFIQAGSGTTILTAANSYNGATNVDAGTLLINGNQSAANGAVSVASGATLGGSGTAGGAVSLLGGAIVAPGSGVGTLTVSNAFTLANTSILNFQLNPANGAVGGGINDLITGVSNLTLDGVLNVSGAGDWTSVANFTTWRLFNYSGTLTNNLLALGTMPTLGSGQSFQIDASTPGQVNLIAVPEPGAVSLLAMLALGGGLLVRRVRYLAGTW